MRSFFVTIAVCMLLIVLSAQGPALSQNRTGFCDKVKSTAESMECINRHMQSEQERLNEAYKQYSEEKSEEEKSDINTAQQAWVAYRDAQCAWEASQADPPALARLHELSCLTALTKYRADFLSALSETKDTGEGASHEFSERPRWMNVLTHDHPDIFWRYGSRQSADLNCDGEDEEFITGLTIAPRIENTNTNHISFSGKIILAALKNPVAGKPKSEIFELPVTAEGTGPHVCSTDVHIEVTSRENVDTKTSCKAALRINDPVCPPVWFYRDGDNYTLEQESNLANAEIQ